MFLSYQKSEQDFIDTNYVKVNGFHSKLSYKLHKQFYQLTSVSAAGAAAAPPLPPANIYL